MRGGIFGGGVLRGHRPPSLVLLPCTTKRIRIIIQCILNNYHEIHASVQMNYVQNQKHIYHKIWVHVQVVLKQCSKCIRFRMDIWLAGYGCKYNYSCPSVECQNSVTPHYDIQLTPMGGGTFPLYIHSPLAIAIIPHFSNSVHYQSSITPPHATCMKAV